MKLQATGSGLDLLNETRCRAGVTFAENTEVHGKGVGRLVHALNMPGSWRTGRGRGSRCRPCPTADYGGQAGIKRLFDLLWADVVDMRVDAAGSDDITFAGDHFGTRTDDHADIGLHIRIARLAYSGNTPVLDADIGLHNSPVIENHCVGNDRIDSTFTAGTLRLAHAISDHLPASKLHFLAVGREVLLYFDDEVGIGETHLVADRWAKHLRIGGAAHCVWHPDYLGDRDRGTVMALARPP